MYRKRFIVVALLFFITSVQANFIYYQDGSLFDSMAKANLGLDVSKYGQTCNYLISNLGINKYYFQQPGEISDADLKKVHTAHYLQSLKKTEGMLDVFKRGGLKPSFVLKWTPSRILRPMLIDAYKTAGHGTLLGVEKVLNNKGFDWAINFSGGYPHAGNNGGKGHEFFNDIAVAINRAQEKKKDCKVLVVNLSLDPSIELANIYKDNNNVFLFDMYAKTTRSIDSTLLNRINFAHEIVYGITEAAYLTSLEVNLLQALVTVNPDVIIYSAGTEIYEYDTFNKSHVKISGNGIIKRDEIVFTLAKETQTPIVMALGGGFAKNVGKDVIGPSIHNLIEKKIISLC